MFILFHYLNSISLEIYLSQQRTSRWLLQSPSESCFFFLNSVKSRINGSLNISWEYCGWVKTFQLSCNHFFGLVTKSNMASNYIERILHLLTNSGYFSLIATSNWKQYLFESIFSSVERNSNLISTESPTVKDWPENHLHYH